MPSMLKVYANKRILNSVIYVIYDFLGLAELFGTPTLIGTWWYMSLALIIIAIMPLLYKFYKSFGWIALFTVTFLLSGFVKKSFNDEIVNYDMIRWLFTLELGMVCADKNTLAKIKGFKLIKKNNTVDYLVKFVLYTAIFVFCIRTRGYMDSNVSYIRDGLIPMFVVIYSYTILAEIPFLRNALWFLGKHSMNIFMSHTILRAYFLKDFLYGLKYSMLTFFVLLAFSVLLSIIIDLLKKYTGYDKLCGKIMSRI